MRRFVLLFALLAPLVGLPAQRPAILRGTPGALSEENNLVNLDNLSRIADDKGLRRMVRLGYLKRVPRVGQGYFVSAIGRSYKGYRDGLYTARPWVLDFLDREGSHFSQAFRGRNFKVTSLARSEEYQKWLRRRNRNASRRTVHTTGAALDISKTGMSAAQLEWMRRHLATLEGCNWVRATEERRQPTFHILVRKQFGQGQCG